MVTANSLLYPPYVGEDGIWSQQIRSLNGKSRPALFLDRDGVILEEVHYLHKVQDVSLINGAATVIRIANESDIPVIVVTNQSGIGRGKFTWEDFTAVQNKMHTALKGQSAFLNAVYACPFHESAKFPWKVAGHPDRKPEPGMLYRAEKSMPIRLSESWIIGDRANDIEAAKNAGLAGGVHVLTGHGNDRGERNAALTLADAKFYVYTSEDIGAALINLPFLS